MYGWVRRTQNFTRFYVSVQLDNGVEAYRTIIVPNAELDNSRFNLYGATLDRIVVELDEMIQNRHQEWVR